MLDDDCSVGEPPPGEINALPVLKLTPSVPWQLVDVFLIHEDMNLVFEFCETDLESILMEQSAVLKPEHIKCHMRMLLDGMDFLHKNFVLHRVSAGLAFLACA